MQSRKEANKANKIESNGEKSNIGIAILEANKIKSNEEKSNIGKMDNFAFWRNPYFL